MLRESGCTGVMVVWGTGIVIARERGFAYFVGGELAPDMVEDGKNDCLAMLLLPHLSTLRFCIYVDGEP